MINFTHLLLNNQKPIYITCIVDSWFSNLVAHVSLELGNLKNLLNPLMKSLISVYLGDTPIFSYIFTWNFEQLASQLIRKDW